MGLGGGGLPFCDSPTSIEPTQACAVVSSLLWSSLPQAWGLDSHNGWISSRDPATTTGHASSPAYEVETWFTAGAVPGYDASRLTTRRLRLHSHPARILVRSRSEVPPHMPAKESSAMA
jgi:hypothetical protein